MLWLLSNGDDRKTRNTRIVAEEPLINTRPFKIQIPEFYVF
jgi:hypothetical protein